MRRITRTGRFQSLLLALSRALFIAGLLVGHPAVTSALLSAAVLTLLFAAACMVYGHKADLSETRSLLQRRLKLTQDSLAQQITELANQQSRLRENLVAPQLAIEERFDKIRADFVGRNAELSKMIRDRFGEQMGAIQNELKSNTAGISALRGDIESSITQMEQRLKPIPIPPQFTSYLPPNEYLHSRSRRARRNTPQVG